MSIDEKELTLARRVARKIGSRWSAIEVDDLEQELTLWLFENMQTVKRYRTEDGGEGKLYVALRRKASRYCAREQVARTGAPLDWNATYTTAQVARALPFVFEETPQSVVTDDPVTGRVLASSSPEDYGNALAVMTDMRTAFRNLPPEVQAVLELRYRDGLTYQQIGDMCQLSVNGARKRVRRAVSRMQDALDAWND